MELITVTKESDPELFEGLCDNCDFDTDHIPKHGRGYITATDTLVDGRKFTCNAEWDYTWGVDWEYKEWVQIEEFENRCPCCNQLIK